MKVLALCYYFEHSPQEMAKTCLDVNSGMPNIEDVEDLGSLGKSMDEEEKMELSKQEEEEEDRVEVKQEVREALNCDVDIIPPPPVMKAN